MLAHPPGMNREKNFHGIMETILSALGAKERKWPYTARCCGTFLSVSRPGIVTPMVNAIIKGAAHAKAECIITACAMCHLNLEVRCTLDDKVPIFHFSEILLLASGIKPDPWWFSRHLVDPRPLMDKRGLL
jgi:heterodisulfide reductase subunit B